MSKFCWPDGKGKRYCISAEDMWDEDVGIILAHVWEEEYPTKFCTSFEENAKNESDISCNTSTSQ
jgi:hypothetical protein